MNHLGQLQGQKQASRLLNQYLAKGAPPLLILSGPEGTGKWSSAEAFVRQYFCKAGTGCGQCIPCRKLERGDHPDFIQFPEDRIPVGDQENPEPFTVRWLIQKRIRYTPFEADSRFILIPRGDLIQHEAETALLKVMEEPPDHTRFIILVRDPGELKETILSRGAIIPFAYLPQSVIERIAGMFEKDQRELMGGSLHLAPFLSTELYKEMRDRILQALDHPLDMLKLEKWITSGEKTGFRDLVTDERGEPMIEMGYLEILDTFALVFLHFAKDHPAKFEIRKALILLQKRLRMERSGLHPFLISATFHKLTSIIEGAKSPAGQ